MESRRFKIGKRDLDEIAREKGKGHHDVSREYVSSIFDKLRQHCIKIETILSKCEEVDTNRDGIIHADDVIDIIDDMLPRRAISRREYHYFFEALGYGKGKPHNIKYLKIEKLYEDYKRNFQEDVKERWFEDEYDEEFSGPRGSIGDFLHKSACPSEIQNYKTLMACLENYERESGVRISINENGFRVPLGPDLKATITFNTNPTPIPSPDNF